jgi:hypothetical protein
MSTAIGEAATLPQIKSLIQIFSASPFPSVPPICRSCSIPIRWCIRSFMSSLSRSLSATACLGTLCGFAWPLSCVAWPLPTTAGGYNSVERSWHCVQHFLFSCKASPPGCLDHPFLCPVILDPLPCDAMAAAQVRLALHVDSCDGASVRPVRLPWLLDLFFCLLPACLCTVCAAKCLVLAVRFVGRDFYC